MTSLRIVPSFLLICLLCSSTALAAERNATRQKFNPPPSASLSYAIKATQNGIVLNGQAVVRWTNAANKFSVTSEARAMIVGKILESKSEGAIDDYGLAPVQFTEKRFRKDKTTASFNRDAKTISFSRSTQTYPLKGGEQDRSSVIWQLISIARAAPARFKPNTEWRFIVVSDHDADPWTFRVISQENIKMPNGDMSTVHVVRYPPPGSKKQKLDIWLAPSMEWYPVRLRFSEADGEYIEQTLEQVNKTAS